MLMLHAGPMIELHVECVFLSQCMGMPGWGGCVGWRGWGARRGGGAGVLAGCLKKWVGNTGGVGGWPGPACYAEGFGCGW